MKLLGQLGIAYVPAHAFRGEVSRIVLEALRDASPLKFASAWPQEGRHNLIGHPGKERTQQPEENLVNRIAEHGFDFWKGHVAKGHSNKRSTDEARGLRQRNSRLHSLAPLPPPREEAVTEPLR